MSISHKQKDSFYNMDHESRITRLEVTNENICQTLIRLEKNIDDGFKDIDKRFDKIDQRFGSIDNRLWVNFYWSVGAFAGVLTLLARILHWI